MPPRSPAAIPCTRPSHPHTRLPPTNQLLERRFTKTGSYHKEPPKVLVFADASNEEINRIYMNEPLQLLMPDGRTMTIPVE